MSDDFQERVEKALDDAGIPKAAMPFFGGGTVQLTETVYAPGPVELAALQDAADAEFPDVKDVEGQCPPS